MSLKLIGNITHGEKYEKNGETKWRNTQLGTLFKNDEDGSYVVKYLGQWCKVWPPRMREEGYQQAKQAVQQNMIEDEIAF
jgi:hypothetical protein